MKSVEQNESIKQKPEKKQNRLRRIAHLLSSCLNSCNKIYPNDTSMETQTHLINNKNIQNTNLDTRQIIINLKTNQQDESKLEKLQWGEINQNFIKPFLLENKFLFDIDGNNLIIKNQDLSFVKSIFEKLVSPTKKVFVCEQQESGDIQVKCLTSYEKKLYILNASVGGLSWGIEDQEVIYKLITLNSLKHSINNDSLIIHNSKYEKIKSLFEKTFSEDGYFTCSQQENGDIHVTKNLITAKKTASNFVDASTKEIPDIHFQSFNSVSQKVKDYISNPNLKIRLVVDRGRRGQGHQAAAITAINRLYELGFQGKLEVLTTDVIKGKEKFLGLLSGLNQDLNKSLDFKKNTIPLTPNITLKTARYDIALEGAVLDCDTYESLDPVDLVYFPANDISLKSALLTQFRAEKAIMTTPSHFFAVNFDSVIGAEVKYSRLLNKTGILFNTPQLKEPFPNPILKIIEYSKGQNKKFDYINLYGAETKKGVTQTIVSSIENSVEKKPLVVFIHKHGSNPNKITKKMNQSDFLELLNKDAPIPDFCVVELEQMPKDCFDIICANSSLLLSESSNAYQLSLSHGLPFIHCLSHGFSISKIPEEIELPKHLRDFEEKYLKVQKSFETGETIESSILNDVMSKIMDKNHEALQYFDSFF